VVEDLRFQNEFSVIKELLGVTIRVVRPSNQPDTDQPSTHASETISQTFAVDFEISNNGTVFDLEQEVQRCLKLQDLGAT